MSDSSPPDASADHGPGSRRRRISIILSASILVVAAGVAALTFLTEPTAQRGGATKKTAMLVEVVRAERGSYHPRIVAQGTVEAARDIVLSPQVGGRVVALQPAFTPGGFAREGELLVQIESADYRHTLTQRESELRQARSNLAITEGRHEAAVEEYALVNQKLPPKQEALVLRKPELDAARDRVSAAEATVEQAQLDLWRTTIEAPFDAHVIRRNVNVGSQVAAGADIGRLVGIDTYWIAVELPLSKLRWVSIPGEDSEGSEVEVRNRQAWPKDAYRAGHVFRRIGALDEDTRMGRVLATIEDPLAREIDNENEPPLTIGEFVEVSIRGIEIEDVVRLNRDYVRDDDTVWVMQDGALHVAEVEIILRDADHAYITSGLEDGAQVVTTPLSTVVEGASLRLGASEEQK